MSGPRPHLRTLAAEKLADPRYRTMDGQRWGGAKMRGQIPIPTHAHPLIRVLVAELNRQATTMGEAADRAGLDRDAVYRWRTTNTPRIDNLDAVLNAIGLRLAVVPIGSRVAVELPREDE